MKNKKFLFLIFLFTACFKKQENPTPVSPLIGTWKLVSVKGRLDLVRDRKNQFYEAKYIYHGTYSLLSSKGNIVISESSFDISRLQYLYKYTHADTEYYNGAIGYINNSTDTWFTETYSKNSFYNRKLPDSMFIANGLFIDNPQGGWVKAAMRKYRYVVDGNKLTFYTQGDSANHPLYNNEYDTSYARGIDTIILQKQ